MSLREKLLGKKPQRQRRYYRADDLIGDIDKDIRG